MVIDHMLGLKENVIAGHRIPAGTGMRNYQTMLVSSADDMSRINLEKEVVEENVES